MKKIVYGYDQISDHYAVTYAGDACWRVTEWPGFYHIMTDEQRAHALADDQISDRIDALRIRLEQR